MKSPARKPLRITLTVAEIVMCQDQLTILVSFTLHPRKHHINLLAVSGKGALIGFGASGHVMGRGTYRHFYFKERSLCVTIRRH
jgi:hypothetical protein